MDLVQNAKTPIMVIEYEPSANKDSFGNPMEFFSWSDELYPPDSHTS
jgi:hypothetical protein